MLGDVLFHGVEVRPERPSPAAVVGNDIVTELSGRP
jgi:molybdopterin biosynthesis enzyme